MSGNTLSNFLDRPLTEAEALFMEDELRFRPNGLADEELAVAAQISQAITRRRDELQAMSPRDQYRHEEGLRVMLNAMEGFYLFDGRRLVEEKGIRATHPWGAVLFPIFDVYQGLEDIHGPLMARKMYEMEVGNPHEAAADARWSKLEPVKQLAFERRKELQGVTRAEAIRRMLPAILDAARAAGVPLTGQTPEATVTKWFRDAGIK